MTKAIVFEISLLEDLTTKAKHFLLNKKAIIELKLDSGQESSSGFFAQLRCVQVDQAIAEGSKWSILSPLHEL